MGANTSKKSGKVYSEEGKDETYRKFDPPEIMDSPPVRAKPTQNDTS
jgi:hypothetical protein